MRTITLIQIKKDSICNIQFVKTSCIPNIDTFEDFIDDFSEQRSKSYASCKTVFGGFVRMLYEDEYGWNKPEAEYDEDANPIATKISLGSVIEHEDCYLCAVTDICNEDGLTTTYISNFLDDELTLIVKRLKELGAKFLGGLEDDRRTD